MLLVPVVAVGEIASYAVARVGVALPTDCVTALVSDWEVEAEIELSATDSPDGSLWFKTVLLACCDSNAPELESSSCPPTPEKMSAASASAPKAAESPKPLSAVNERTVATSACWCATPDAPSQLATKTGSADSITRGSSASRSNSPLLSPIFFKVNRMSPDLVSDSRVSCQLIVYKSSLGSPPEGRFNLEHLEGQNEPAPAVGTEALPPDQ